MRESDDRLKQHHPKDRADWRRWLEENHATVPGVWLVYAKPGGRPGLTHGEALEEALCFGWVDGRAGAADGDRSVQLFAPRRPGSAWSKLNKQRVAKLIRAGLMMPAGLEQVNAAKSDGSWDAVDAVEELTIPADLRDP